MGMSEKYITDKIGNLITFNPQEVLKGGTFAKKIAMEKLIVGQRKIVGYEYATFSTGAKFRNGDTLLAKITPCLENGKTAIVDFLNEDDVAFGSTEYIVMRPSYLNSYFIYCLARDEEFRSNVIKNMNGSSGRQRVDAKFIKEYKK